MFPSAKLQLYVWLVALFGGIIVWLYLDLASMQIDYKRHAFLVNQTSGAKMKPYDVYDLAKVIKQSDDYINATNAQERLFDLEYNLNFENPFTIDQSYSRPEQQKVSGWPVANQTKCGQQLHWIQAQLAAHRNFTFLKGRLGFELTQLMDSFGRAEAGLYSGLVTWLGSYEQCMRTQLDGGAIKTRYCLAKMRPKWWKQTQPKSLIRIGACLPETCDTNSFELHKEPIEALIKLGLTDLYKEGLEFESLFCLPDERSPLRQIPAQGHLFLWTISLWLSIILTATIFYELKMRRSTTDLLFTQRLTNEIVARQQEAQADSELSAQFPEISTKTLEIQQRQQFMAQKHEESTRRSFSLDLVESLSIRNSLKEFKKNTFRVKYHTGEQARVDLNCLDSLKIIMAILVVLGHSAYIASLYSRSLSNRIEINTSLIGRMALSVARCVDTFFFFFGLLTAYTLMRKFRFQHLSNPLVWMGVNFGVLLRIGPIFMLVFWYSKTISPYIGSGPWWDYGVHQDSMKGVCMSDPWWRSIPYFGTSDTIPAPACLLPGWFIVSYAKISLLLPLLTFLVCALPKNTYRYLLISMLAVISTLQVTIKMQRQTSVKIEHVSLYGSFLIDLLEKFESTGFMSTFGRLGTVSVGCLTGYLLRQYELGAITRWPRWLSHRITLVLVALLHLVIIFMPIIGELIARATKHAVSLEEFIITNVIVAIAWPVLNAIAFVNATTIYNNFVVVRFFGNSFWHVFNRLGLCIYLVHWEVIFVGMTNFEHAPTHGFVTDVMKMWSFGVFFSIIIAFVIHILIEAPVSNVMMLFVRKLSQQFDKQEDKVTAQASPKHPQLTIAS